MLSKYLAHCYQDLLNSPLSHWLESLPAQMKEWQNNSLHGEFKKWLKLVDKLPQPEQGEVDIKNGVIIGKADDVSDYTQRHIEGLLRQFMPWRKGPFSLYGVEIDTEWRSDWKWERVKPHISPLANRYVLDVGCGSGYHMWRMAGEQAKGVYGIDPTQLFLIQFMAIKRFMPAMPVHLLPLGIEDMQPVKAFDTVFSMGVLYHRRDPIMFLQQLKDQLRPGGELVLETLVVEGDDTTVLMAGERYAQMRNVWFLPSTGALIQWLQRVGFTQCKVVDVCVTTTEEQRATQWMTNQSLKDFLDPLDSSKTIEGYPAPIRAVITATKK